jgi:hypothetical protein
MRNILTFIGVTVVLVICSIADFDLGPDAERRWNATQQAYEYDLPLARAVNYPVYDNPSGCLAILLPEEVLTGTDTACLNAALVMEETMGNYEVECLFIVNDGWIPTSENPVDQEWVNYLISTDGGPANLDDIACEDCPFTKLERCPDCVRHFDELYRRTYDNADE